MKKNLFYLTGIVLIAVACNSSDEKNEKVKYTDLWQIYMSNQIDTLTKANPRLIDNSQSRG